jgi:PAS domain S-box-containing protein
MNTDRSSDPGDRGSSPLEGPTPSDPTAEFAGADAHRLRYQELFEFAPDCQLMTDHQGIILEANHAAASLFQCPKEFLIGKPLGLLVRKGDRGRFYDCLARLGQAGGSDEFEARVGRREETRDVKMRVAPSAGPGEAPLTFRWLLRDLTERRRAEDTRTELLRRLVSAQENERRRVAREIHDQLGQEITGLTLGLKVLEASLPAGTPGRLRLRELQEAVDRMGRNTHEMALELRPTVLDDLGLRAALEFLIERWSERVSVPVDFHFATPETGRFDPDVETTIYRVVQEALTNVARHAGAARVSVIVEYRDGHLMALVEDDGRGFDPDGNDRTGRLGLLGMEERIVLLGGGFQVESSPGAGTTIRARIRCLEMTEPIRL